MRFQMCIWSQISTSSRLDKWTKDSLERIGCNSNV
ncbi:hypothetical protein Gogos_004602 [Gossypium gossypioides]|uniref:Uncharacterized protein n=1 Tax=Gossypium gossypioides TaxID=34282 RepID=A0A7J9CGX3_GOSGO|nr:hypothetical protein [Gossypium gossypioides]